MENNKSINETFAEKAVEHNIVKAQQRSLPLAIIIAGIAMALLPLVSSAMQGIALPLIGTAVLIAGIVMFAKAPKHRYTVTKKPVLQKDFYYSLNDKNYLMACLNGDVKPGYKFTEDGNKALLLKTYTEKDGNFMAVQLQQYVPFEYQTVTDTLFFHGPDAQRLHKGIMLAV